MYGGLYGRRNRQSKVLNPWRAHAPLHHLDQFNLQNQCRAAFTGAQTSQAWKLISILLLFEERCEHDVKIQPDAPILQVPQIRPHPVL